MHACTDLYHLERGHEDIRRFFEPVFAAGKIPLTAGGDHSITYPIFQAMAPKEPILNPERTIQIGIRGAQNSDEGWRYSIESGMRVVFIEEFDARGRAAIAEEARRVVGDAPVYLSLDVDGLDPVFTPGTGTPEIGGLTTRETLALLRGLEGLNWVGGDVVEVSPPYDPSGNTALIAATLMYEMLCLFARRSDPTGA